LTVLPPGCLNIHRFAATGKRGSRTRRRAAGPPSSSMR
jgi:hypothetical protein